MKCTSISEPQIILTFWFCDWLSSLFSLLSDCLSSVQCNASFILTSSLANLHWYLLLYLHTIFASKCTTANDIVHAILMSYIKQCVHDLVWCQCQSTLLTKPTLANNLWSKTFLEQILKITGTLKDLLIGSLFSWDIWDFAPFPPQTIVFSF